MSRFPSFPPRARDDSGPTVAVELGAGGRVVKLCQVLRERYVLFLSAAFRGEEERERGKERGGGAKKRTGEIFSLVAEEMGGRNGSDLC